ncbi:zinc knuckle CX2CX4HX4C containing protein [Tanacetum coccineum]|uniref:Zinc knuckle CX2CX4HX4C containing protein n=1 Tax=Tanacetum coccineum TaxID=301880 RepID=A0ABQ4Z0W5_9ASTR
MGVATRDVNADEIAIPAVLVNHGAHVSEDNSIVETSSGNTYAAGYTSVGLNTVTASPSNSTAGLTESNIVRLTLLLWPNVVNSVNVPDDADYDVWLPLASVHEVNDRMKNSLYGYFIGKRLAFPVVEWFVPNNWEKYGLKKVTMVKDFFFIKFSFVEGVDSVLRDCPWMIHGIPIFFKKWLPSISLLKE